MGIVVEGISCTHEWVKFDSKLENSELCLNCQAFCARDTRGKIWYYDSGPEDLEWEGEEAW